MSSRGTADIVFCVDASASMDPCIDGVKRHISSFVDAFKTDANKQWDLRLDFIAHTSTGSTFSARSAFEHDLVPALYKSRQGRFFTNDVTAFQRALADVETGVNETPLIALDCAVDFPWRERSGCHRIVVLLTDEPVEGGNQIEESLRLADALVAKVMAQKVMLFLVTPDSEGFEAIAAADKCEWEVIDGGDGLATVDFRKLLQGIAKSISKSQTPLGAAPPVARRGLFGQQSWV